ncbi:hypothetical protein MKEN_01204600 [Mycena kentingensis (nom. inval.)]|nr:hypothetical protein MKEN_01204600 [Mycena kentingensis (nom. inval.)]
MSQPPPPTTPYAYPVYPAAGYPQTPGVAYPHPQTPGIAYPQTPVAAYPHPQTPGAAYPYPYGYYYAAPPPQSQTAAVPRAPSTAPKPAPQRAVTSTESVPAASPSATGAAATTGRAARKATSVKGLFTRELKNLMYAFGDDRNPASDTANVLEEILIEYITDVCQTATAESKRARLSIEDIRRALSRPADAKKLARMEELLFMQEDIKRARAEFEENEMSRPREF